MPHASWPVVVDPWTGCWLWLRGKPNSNGYSTHWGPRGPRAAHEHVYETEVGPIPERRVLDHLCRRRRCCNPAHLEPIRRGENERRKWWAHRSQIQACPKGHILAVHGRRTPEGGIVCRVCSGVWRPGGGLDPELV